MNKIKENWATIEAFERALQRTTGDPEAGFPRDIFGNIIMRAEYKMQKKGKTRNQDIIVRFCPFTGKPLRKQENLMEHE